MSDEVPPNPLSPTLMSPIGSESTSTPDSSSQDEGNLIDLSLLDETTDNNDKANAPGGTAGKTYSKVWDHYHKVQIDGKAKAKCKYCGTCLLGDPKQGTSHLMKHQNRCPRKKNKDVRQQILQANFNKDTFELLPLNFDKDTARRELAKMIIMHEYPLKIVDHEGFKNFCKSLNPLFNVMSRNTIKSDCMKIYEHEKEVTLQILEKNDGRIAVTTDMWTSTFQKKGFMAITTHYIDNNWKLQSRIIRFIYVPSPHTGEVLCEKLFDCFLDWNIDRKLSTITVDNCSTNDAMMNMLIGKLPLDTLLVDGKLFHMRCCAHILNLIVKDGLGVIDGAIENIRDSVAFWTGSQRRWEKFEDAARQLHIPITKKLVLDCKTRWTSTYLMLRIALDYKDIFARLKYREPMYKCCPSEDEWNTTNQICGKLKLFFTITELFSGTKYPTTNLYFPNICEIKVALLQRCICGVEVIESMTLKMIDKFDKYWSVVHGIMGVATVLDPRYKSDLLEYYFGKIYFDDADDEVQKILMLCRDLFEQYEKKDQLKGNGDSSRAGNGDDGELISLSDFDLYTSRKKRKPVRSELDQYLEEDVLPRASDFDVLSWWKSNKGKYSILSQIAKDILAIPVSTVASESAFSTSGRLIGPHRSRLHPNTIEALMCSQNWLSANLKDCSLDGYENVFYDSDEETAENMI